MFEQDTDYRVLSQLRAAEQQFDLQWVRLAPKSTIVYKSIGESEIRKKTGASVVGVVRDGQLRPNPDAEFVLMPNDLIAIIGSEGGTENLFVCWHPQPLVTRHCQEIDDWIDSYSTGL